MKDVGTIRETALVEARISPADTFRERCLEATVAKYAAADVARGFDCSIDSPFILGGHLPSDEFAGRGIRPTEVVERAGNALVYGGASAFFDLLIGAANVTAFNNANAYLGVGTSATAWAATQTDLLAAGVRKGMETSYPAHTDGVTSANDTCVWKSSWGTSEANQAWAEWALFNASTSGRMLQRKVESFGTKTSAAIWTLTVTLDLS